LWKFLVSFVFLTSLLVPIFHCDRLSSGRTGRILAHDNGEQGEATPVYLVVEILQLIVKYKYFYII
jgi:hypothetical protein